MCQFLCQPAASVKAPGMGRMWCERRILLSEKSIPKFVSKRRWKEAAWRADAQRNERNRERVKRVQKNSTDRISLRSSVAVLGLGSSTQYFHFGSITPLGWSTRGSDALYCPTTPNRSPLPYPTLPHQDHPSEIESDVARNKRRHVDGMWLYVKPRIMYTFTFIYYTGWTEERT